MVRFMCGVVFAMASIIGVAFADDPPEPAELLKTIDGALVFYDHQTGLFGYSAKAMGANGSKTEALGAVRLDPLTGTKTSVAWTPACGPWRLTTLVGFEIELFAQPWTQRFGGDDWTRQVEPAPGGWTLHLKPKAPIGAAAPLSPAITGLHVQVDASGVPRTATLDLDQQFMKDPGTIGFEYETAGGLQRIRRVTHSLSSANLRITPVVAFTFVPHKPLTVLERVEFSVAGRELSGTLGGTITSRLSFTQYAFDKKPK